LLNWTIGFTIIANFSKLTKIHFLEIDMGTQEIYGKSSWELAFAKGIIKRHGHFQFTIQYFKILVIVSQPLDLTKRLIIDDLHFDLGNIQIM
jgi:hypothetical protein